jgi:hypothetical protein
MIMNIALIILAFSLTSIDRIRSMERPILPEDEPLEIDLTAYRREAILSVFYTEKMCDFSEITADIITRSSESKKKLERCTKEISAALKQSDIFNAEELEDLQKINRFLCLELIKTGFWRAVAENNITAIKNLLKDTSTPITLYLCTQDIVGNNVLTLAIEEKHEELATFLINCMIAHKYSKAIVPCIFNYQRKQDGFTAEQIAKKKSSAKFLKFLSQVALSYKSDAIYKGGTYSITAPINSRLGPVQRIDENTATVEEIKKTKCRRKARPEAISSRTFLDY